MTKHFWALPVIAQLVLASQGSFSVLDDLLAFPQYRIVFADSAISEDHAQSLHASSKQHPDAPQQTTTVELSHDSNNAHANPFAHSSRDGNDETADDEELAVTYERMTLHAQPYLCRIPIVDTSHNNNNNTDEQQQSAADEEKELARATDRGWELLRGMRGSCIYFLSGWWSYSFCYADGVRQFHQLPPSRGVPVYPPVEDERVQGYVLGTFPQEGGKKGRKGDDADEVVDDEGEAVPEEKDGRDETGVARLETKGETRYLVQKLTGGTTCDLTGKARKIEVQFHCHPNTPDRIGMIKEVATCSYLMVIYTPRLCNDVAFLPPQENRAHAISCAPIVSSSSLAPPRPPHHPRKPSSGTAVDLPAALQPAGQDGEDHQTSTPLPTIGGTPVGANRLVGGPDPARRLKKSAVVGGAAKGEKLLGTVASSSGGDSAQVRVMGADELKSLGVKKPEDVEELAKKLGRIAGPKKAWRLELVEVRGGVKEYRGVIEEDEEGKGEGEGGKEAGEGKGGEERGLEEGEEAEEEWVEYDWGDYYEDEEGNLYYEDGEGIVEGDGGREEGGEEGSEETYREEL